MQLHLSSGRQLEVRNKNFVSMQKFKVCPYSLSWAAVSIMHWQTAGSPRLLPYLYLIFSPYRHLKNTPGRKLPMRFASGLFTFRPRLQQLESFLVSFLNGIHLAMHAVSITLGSTLLSLLCRRLRDDNMRPLPPRPSSKNACPCVHHQAPRVRRVEPTLRGPTLDFVLQRAQEADAELLRQHVENSPDEKHRNLEAGEMGGLRGGVRQNRSDGAPGQG